ncbi:MAG: nuclear transport factor 2 family protein [Gemmatimonadetes bacterium]|nr:nuclear transport factor 2 family protein [Gemmatimonadota bacterium]NNM03826.1 nuclear transport factor 2 family protein [Gemmatimonadota bacterium]
MSELTGSDKETIRHLLEDVWVEGCVRQEWDRCLGIMSEDYVYMIPDQPALRGKAEAQAFFEGFPTISRMSQSIETVGGTRELAVARGTYALSMDVDGTEVSGTGKFLSTATLKNDKWVFTSACFNWDAPPAPND